VNSTCKLSKLWWDNGTILLCGFVLGGTYGIKGSKRWKSPSLIIKWPRISACKPISMAKIHETTRCKNVTNVSHLVNQSCSLSLAPAWLLNVNDWSTHQGVKEHKVKLLLKVEVLVSNEGTVNVAIFNEWLHVFQKPNASFDNILHSPASAYCIISRPTTLMNYIIIACYNFNKHIIKGTHKWCATKVQWVLQIIVFPKSPIHTLFQFQGFYIA